MPEKPRRVWKSMSEPKSTPLAVSFICWCCMVSGNTFTRRKYRMA